MFPLGKVLFFYGVWFVIGSFCTTSLWGQNSAEANPKKSKESLQTLVDAFEFKEGRIKLPGGIAKVHVRYGFSYLNPKDTKTLLVDIWGNPRSKAKKNWGMIVSTDIDLLSAESWGVLIAYEETGHIDDDESLSFDDSLIFEMQNEVSLLSEQREAAGHPSIDLIGWAISPQYDILARQLYWAKEYRSGDSTQHVLNYDVRILGRTGVIILQAVAFMNQIDDIRQASPKILSMIEFIAGHRYQDFDPKKDKRAVYGISDLVAGRVAPELNWRDRVWIKVFNYKNLYILGFIALCGIFAKVWSHRSH